MCKELLATESGRAKYNMFNCSGGEYYGRPLNFGELMTLSDDNWENRACDNKLAYLDLVPLRICNQFHYNLFTFTFNKF